ncbi:MAG: hypothetical protein LBQ88_16770 [Treponema sp.]|jgi:hypothetical protein|nr:hypothetical protein [Treponema sp.]
MVVLAVGQKPYGLELIKEIKKAGYKVTVLGDAKKPRKFIDATREGFYAGLDI